MALNRGQTHGTINDTYDLTDAEVVTVRAASTAAHLACIAAATSEAIAAATAASEDEVAAFRLIVSGLRGRGQTMPLDELVGCYLYKSTGDRLNSEWAPKVGTTKASTIPVL